MRPKYLTEALGQFQHNPANVHVSFYDHGSSFVEVSDVDREVPRPVSDDLPISQHYVCLFNTSLVHFTLSNHFRKCIALCKARPYNLVYSRDWRDECQRDGRGREESLRSKYTRTSVQRSTCECRSEVAVI